MKTKSLSRMLAILILLAILLISITAKAGVCIDSDVNGSGTLDIDDAVSFYLWIFAGGQDPVPCDNCLSIGQWYVVTDTSYERHTLEAIGDSLFSITTRWVTWDSVYVQSINQFRRINVRGYHIADTFYLGSVAYDTTTTDTNGIGIGSTQ